MFDKLDSWIEDQAGKGVLGSLLSVLINLAIVLVITLIAYTVIVAVIRFIHKRSRIDFIKQVSGIAITRRLANKCASFLLFFFLLAFAFRIPRFQSFIERISVLGMILALMSIINVIINIIIDYYGSKEVSRSRPIKGPLQIVKIVIFIILSMIFVSVLINQNPVVLVSGVGAFTAILTIVFKDALLGLVAGMQITSEGLLKIGDWVKIPSLDVEGSVTDISLISVRVTAFNNTVISVPAYAFVSNAFVNYHDTITEGKRQVVRTIYVDASSIRPEDGGSTTNLTRYRQALANRLMESEHIKTEFPLQVRTANSKDGFGIPVEILFTTDNADYDEYCAYSSYVGELAYAALKDFRLTSYQAAALTPS